MSQKILYLPNAARHCQNCGCTKAVPRAAARRHPGALFDITCACVRCGDRIIIDDGYLSDWLNERCAICGAEPSDENQVIRVANDTPRAGMSHPPTRWAPMCQECLEKADVGA